MEHNINILTPEQFPSRVREIDDPPERLYLRGTLPSLDHYILSVVGSRKYTSYGKSACEQLIGGLAGHPITIVSGLALGIDSIAHTTALSSGLPTLAVPGSGLNDTVLYPATHLSLARDILEHGGALLSEYEPDFSATTWSFPRRNRIMAGLSHAVLVVEAVEKSGTLITARLAYEYNRDVLTVPGSIFSESSAGPHQLIRDGATPVTSSRDILDALGIAPHEHTAHASVRSYDDCTDNERTLVNLLAEPHTRDELITQSGLSASETNPALSLLEMKGYIKEEMGEIVLTGA